MYGSSPRRLGTLLVTPLALAAAFACATAANARADHLLDVKRARYARVRRDIHRLDAHAEKLTEQYDHVVWELGVLRRRMRIATRRLIAEQIKLRHDQALLGKLMVEQYKGGSPHTIEIVLSSTSMAQVTDGMDLRQRLDTAITLTVEAVDAA